MPKSDPLFGVLEEYLDYCKVSCTVATQQQYAMVLNRLVIDLGGGTRLIEEITPRELQRYQSQHWGALKPATLSGYTAILKTFFAWAQQRQYIAVSPAAHLPRPRRAKHNIEPRAIPPEHLRTMLDYARHTSVRNYALLMFLIATGARVGGALSVTLDGLQLNQYRARIRVKGGKTDMVYFGDKTRDALEQYLAQRPKVDNRMLWIWDKQPYRTFEDGGVRAMIVSICQRTNLPRQYFTHGTRHSLGIAWTKAGVALGIVSSKLHHSDIGITHQFYATPDQEFIAMVSRRYEELPLLDHPEDIVGKKNITRAG